MNQDKSFQSTWERSTTRRFLHWISSWRVLRGILFGSAVLVTMVFLIYAVENWRGSRAWEKYRIEAEARGVAGDWKAYVPPPVPDADNFASTPFLAPLLDFNPDRSSGDRLAPGESLWRDTNGFAKAQAFAKDLPNVRESGNRRQGRRTDLAAWVKGFEEKRATPDRGKLPEESVAAEHDPVRSASALLEFLGDSEPVIEELREASKRPLSRFAVRYDEENPTGILLPHLAVTKRVCQVLRLRALAAFELGNVESGHEDLMLMLRLAEAHRSEPFIISQLVRLANQQIAMEALWEGLADHRFTESQLERVQSALREPDLMRDMDHALRADRAFGIKTIDWIRTAPDARAAMDMYGHDSGMGISTLLQLLPDGWFQFEKLNYARLFEECILVDERTRAGRIDPDLVEGRSMKMTLELQKSGNPTAHLMLSRILLPALSKVIVKAAYGQCTLREADVACGLERFRIARGVYPERLEELVPQYLEQLPGDLITGDPLIYRRIAPDRFIVYSVGWNQTDDGGQYLGEPSKEKTDASGKKPSSSRAGLDLEEGDWVWTPPEA